MDHHNNIFNNVCFLRQESNITGKDRERILLHYSAVLQPFYGFMTLGMIFTPRKCTR